MHKTPCINLCSHRKLSVFCRYIKLSKDIFITKYYSVVPCKEMMIHTTFIMLISLKSRLTPLDNKRQLGHNSASWLTKSKGK